MSWPNDSHRCQGKRRSDRPAYDGDSCPVHGPRQLMDDNAHGLASIDEVINDLLAKQERLSALLDTTEEVGDLIKLFALHSQNASRLGRLLRDRQALNETPTEGLLAVIDQALDELSRELGLEL
jgi:hypothetical protein